MSKGDLTAHVTLSEVGQSCSTIRLRNSIRSRMASIDARWSFVTQLEHKAWVNPNYRRLATESKNLLKELDRRLDKILSIPHTNSMVRGIRKSFNDLGPAAEHLNSIFGVTAKRSSVGDPLIAAMIESIQAKSILARIREISWRIEEEVSLRASEGWYIIFNTLTVRPGDYKKVFENGSYCWRDYVRCVERAVGVSIYGSVRNADFQRKSNPYHSYFAVVEPQ